MTGKERIMTALRNKRPDRVPATPDISTMVPCKMTGKPFWEIEYYRNPPLQQAYIEAAKYFGIDGWLYNGTLHYRQRSEISYQTEIISRTDDRMEVLTAISTPDGDMTSM